MKLRKIISISLIFIMSVYIILSSFEGLGNVSYAGQLITIEEAEKMCPGISGLVNELKSKHAGYNFQFYNTGIDWNEAILCEYQGHGASPKNLFNVNASYAGMWHCPVCGTQTYDNGSLCCASMESLRYMMDPRNSITEDSVFQFKNLESPDVSYDDVVRVIAGTFLDHEECARAVVEASQAYNINGYYLVAKMLTEHGRNGSTLSNGVIKDGVTYYNFFNIGAYGNSVQAIITNGTNQAAAAGWSSKRASILGGAEIVKNAYVGKGQNTCYYQKFNVVNTQSGLFSHQYAQNILSAENEGRKFKSYYTINGEIVGTHTFTIPLYLNMPQTAQARPDSAKMNTITYETAVVTANGGLKVRSNQSINSLQIGSISQNINVKVLMRAAQPAADGYYWDLVISDSNGVCGYVARNYINKTGSGTNSGTISTEQPQQPVVTPETPAQTQPQVPNNTTTTNNKKVNIVGNNVEVSAKMNVNELIAKYPDVVLTDKSGARTDKICTGYTATINGTRYSVVKKGDVTGDGEVNVLDAVAIVNHIKETNVITEVPKIQAAKIKNAQNVTVMDVVALLNYIKEDIEDISIQ